MVCGQALDVSSIKHIFPFTRAIKHLLEALKPYTIENGGPLKVEHASYVEGRGNLIIGYSPPSATEGTISFVGSHLDCVPADPETWERHPFKLTVEVHVDFLMSWNQMFPSLVWLQNLLLK